MRVYMSSCVCLHVCVFVCMRSCVCVRVYAFVYMSSCASNVHLCVHEDVDVVDLLYLLCKIEIEQMIGVSYSYELNHFNGYKVT